MASIKRFEDIECWQLTRLLDKEVFKVSQKTGLSKDYGLKDQLLKSTGSVMDNIAEGFERGGNKEFFQFLSISKGSAGEVKSQLYRTLDREYITTEKFDELYNQTDLICKKISSLMNYLSGSDLKGSKYKPNSEH